MDVKVALLGTWFLPGHVDCVPVTSKKATTTGRGYFASDSRAGETAPLGSWQLDRLQVTCNYGWEHTAATISTSRQLNTRKKYTSTAKEYSQVQSSAAEYSQVQPSTANEYSHVQPSTTTYRWPAAYLRVASSKLSSS